jgi:hypothetical protein
MAKKPSIDKKATDVRTPAQRGAQARRPARSNAQSRARLKTRVETQLDGRLKDRSPKRRRHTPEDKRGGQFARHMEVLAVIHRNHGGKPFNKKMIAEWLRDDLDRDLDDLSAWYEASAAAQGVASAAPPGLETIQEASRNRNAERAIKSLQKIGMLITRTDEDGKPHRKKRVKAADKKKPKKAKKKDAKKPGGAVPKVWWTYDPTGRVSTDLQRLFTDFKLTGFELEGIMGCTGLLENLYGLPMEERVRRVFKRITSHVPPRLMREAAEQGVVWRYLFRRPAKYEAQKKLLQEWNDATILRRPCTMRYAKADVCWLYHLDPSAQPAPEPRRIAAFGTLFIPEEDSIYLVGCEADQRNPGKWRRPILYKFDRVIDLRMEDDENPQLADMPSHRRIDSHEGMPSRLDLEKLFADSAGAFFHYGKTHTLVVRVHDPAQIALCLERPFHRRQRVDVSPSRNEIKLTVDGCFLDEVIPRLLTMKGGFTVEQPPELAGAIRDLAHDIASRHSPTTATVPGKPR